jgi:tetratricopeptide (TPR) repeat protein
MYENLPVTMIQAAHLYRIGRLAEAAQICGVILKDQQENFDALHLLGVIRWAQGRLAEALALQKTALAVRPESYGAHTYVGLTLASLGRYEEAIYSYHRALAIKPKYAEVHYKLGNVLKAVGRNQEAIASYHRALAIKPAFAEAHFNLGYALQALSRDEEAINSYRRAVTINPNYVEAHNNLGNVLQAVGRYEEAIASYYRALAIEPGFSEAHNNLGNVLQAVGRYEEGIASYYRAVAIKPGFSEAHNNLGNILQVVGRYEEAITSYYRALAIKPDFADAHNNLGNVLTALGCQKEAIASYYKALAIKPNYADAHRNIGFAALAMDDFETGWKEYEWRWETVHGLAAKRNFMQPSWLGAEDIAGKTILLHGEQGLGDTIQFVRYVPLVTTMGAAVILEVQKGLRALLSNLMGAKAIFEQGETLPSFDFHCPLMSLPLAFRTELATIPADIPYVLPDPARQAEWERRLPKRERPRIGLAWSGNPKHQQDHNRSIPLQKLMPLIDETEFNFYVLQKEIRPADFELLKRSRSLIKHSDRLNDFADTAALVSLMDLVISVDTSLAHLAGAMGKHTWILLAFNADWRWRRAHQDSPWYPTMRLFRQPKVCDWASVIESILLECKKLFVSRPSPFSRQDAELHEGGAKGAEAWHRHI